MHNAARTVGAALWSALLIAVVIIVADAWFNNTMGEYYDPADIWGTMKWGYAARLVLAMTGIFFATGLVIVGASSAISRLTGADVQGRD